MNQFADNPYEPSADASSGQADSKVKGPAIGLIVCGVLWLLCALYYIFTGVVVMVADPTALLENNPGVNQEQLQDLQEQGIDPGSLMQATGGGYLGAGVLGVIISIVIILGAIKMLNLKSRGLAFAAAVLAMLPCNCGCAVGIPIGIWALITLSDDAVKSAFK